MKKSDKKKNKKYSNYDVDSIKLIDIKFKKVKKNLLSLSCKLMALTFIFLIILFIEKLLFKSISKSESKFVSKSESKSLSKYLSKSLSSSVSTIVSTFVNTSLSTSLSTSESISVSTSEKAQIAKEKKVMCTNKNLYWHNEMTLNYLNIKQEISNYNKYNISFDNKNDFDKRENPKVSIILTVYNQENYLKIIYTYIQRQTLKDIEIIFVDLKR